MTVLGFKMTTMPAGAVGRWIIGEVVSENDKTTVLKRVCNVFDFLESVKVIDENGKEGQQPTPVSRVFVDEITGSGTLEIRHSETEAFKELKDGEIVFKTYLSVIESYRLRSSGLVPPTLAQTQELNSTRGEPN